MNTTIINKEQFQITEKEYRIHSGYYGVNYIAPKGVLITSKPKEIMDKFFSARFKENNQDVAYFSVKKLNLFGFLVNDNIHWEYFGSSDEENDRLRKTIDKKSTISRQKGKGYFCYSLAVTTWYDKTIGWNELPYNKCEWLSLEQ